ncbi:hypothetical protein [Tenacibaculum maritimum]|uniref:hypothetical protein n=1 Tax=Tenacibaculum maritimum TaxID=107401 RepID=UPI0038770957
MAIKNKEAALEQLKTLKPAALIRLANLSTDERIQRVFNCPLKYAVLKSKIDKELQ